MFAMEAPLYRSYNVTAINKLSRTADVEMGISGDKIEITPMPNKGFFQWQPKASTVNDEDVVLCELLSQKLSQSLNNQIINQLIDVLTICLMSDTGKSTFKVIYWSGSEYKNWTFEADTDIADEILRKLEFVMKMKTSYKRNEYFLIKEQQKSLKK